jgi:hypothetical protein
MDPVFEFSLSLHIFPRMEAPDSDKTLVYCLLRKQEKENRGEREWGKGR